MKEIRELNLEDGRTANVRGMLEYHGYDVPDNLQVIDEYVRAWDGTLYLCADGSIIDRTHDHVYWYDSVDEFLEGTEWNLHPEIKEFLDRK